MGMGTTPVPEVHLPCMATTPKGTHWLTSDEPHRFGSGWISGTIGAILGLAALGTAGCLALPAHLTTPELRAWYPLPLVRHGLHAAMLSGFLLGMVSLWLRRKKVLGATAVSSALLAALVVALAPSPARNTELAILLGLDVFVLSLLLYSAVFLPLERLWPQRPDQPTFRTEWWTDLGWFFCNALLLQFVAALTTGPAAALSFAIVPGVQAQVQAQPLLVQFALIVVVSDLVQYHVHRACHRVPLLWRFHSIHHSATAMDWLAGSRLHLVDAVLTRALVYAPLFLLGFDARAMAGYLVFVAAQATFVHANCNWRLRWLEPWLTTPRFHHWHHADAPLDQNYAVHLPWLDRLFGTHHLPPANEWPQRYGLANGATGPRGFWRQLLAPFVGPTVV